MFGNYEPYIPEAIGDLIDLLGSTVLLAPACKDLTGYFPEKNIDTVFFSINEGLRNVKSKIGDDNYKSLRAMTVQMRAYFDADPEDTTGEAIKGKDIALDMMEILKSGKGDDYWD